MNKLLQRIFPKKTKDIFKNSKCVGYTIEKTFIPPVYKTTETLESIDNMDLIFGTPMTRTSVYLKRASEMINDKSIILNRKLSHERLSAQLGIIAKEFRK